MFGVLTDMMRGRPAIYATFSSYDEVARTTPASSAQTRWALRKLDEQFSRERARRYAARPCKLVVLSDHGQTQGATFKQRNGYGLQELVERNLEHGNVTEIGGGDEQSSMVGHALSENGFGQKPKKRAKNDVSDKDVIVLGSSSLGLVYLMEKQRRLLWRRSTRCILACCRPCARIRTSVGCSSTPSSAVRSPSARTARTTSTRAGSKAWIRSCPSRRTRPSICSGPTGSRTSLAASWSAASTTRISTQVAPSEASLLPWRHRRPPDAPLPPLPGPLAAYRRADRRCGESP